MQIEKYQPPSAPLRLWHSLLEQTGVRTIPAPELAAKYGSAKSQYIDIDGTRIHYQVEGSGPPLLMLHGVLASLHTWDGWVEALRDHFSIMRIDIPGFGLTGPMATGNYTPAYAIEVFEKMRVALGYEKFHLAGSSLGGFLSWYYAVHHPDRVDKLVLLDPLSYPQVMPLLMRFCTAPGIAQIAPHAVPRFFIEQGTRQVYGDPTRIAPGVIDRYHQLLLREGNRGAMVEYFQKADLHFTFNAPEPLWQRIAEIKNPTLLMWGARDRWLPVSHVESWKRDVPHLKVKIYDGVGHIPMEEIPAQSAADALAFLLDG